MACAPWAGLSLEEYPNLAAWAERMQARQAVVDGMDVPNPNPLKEALADPEKMKQAIAAAQNMMVSSKGKL